METPHRIIVERLLQERRSQAAAERLARQTRHGAAAHRPLPTRAATGTAPAEPRASADAICHDAMCGDARVAGEAA